MRKIKLSVIAWSRNDNYKSGSGITTNLERLKFFYKSLKASLQGINWELVLVDYNPPPDRSLLSKIWDWGDINLNHVILTNDQWLKLIENNKKLKATFIESPVYAGHGYYTGLLYAKGDYVLYTTTDNIFPPGLNNILEDIKPGILYRAQREKTNEEAAVQNSSKIISGAWMPEVVHTKHMGHAGPGSKTIWKGCGDFMLMSRKNCLQCNGYLPLAHPKPYGIDAQFIFFAMSLGISVKMLDYRFVNIHIDDTNIHKTKASLKYSCLEYDHYNFIRCDPDFGLFRRWADNKTPKGSASHNAPDANYTVIYDYEWIRNIFEKVMEGVH